MFEQKGCLSCAKREACIRRLCSTVVYDYLLTAVFLVSPPFVSRTSDRRVSMYGDLGCSLSGLLGCLRNHPVRTPHSSASAASRNSKGAYLRRCAHITPADKLASLFFLSPPPFPLPISPGLILLYFSCNLGEVLQGSSSNRPPPHASSTISGWVRERERLDMATISLSATLSRLDVAIHQLSFNIAHFACLAFLKLLHK